MEHVFWNLLEYGALHPMATITVKLSASLRDHVPTHHHGLIYVQMDPQATVGALIHTLGLSSDQIRMIMVNGRGDGPDRILQDGDRVALFPPEAAFNMYVALSFRRDLGR